MSSRLIFKGLDKPKRGLEQKKKKTKGGNQDGFFGAERVKDR